MAPPLVEQTGESGGESQRSLPTPFLTKTYQLVDDPLINDIISWNEDGSTFIVWRPAEFARDLLPKLFKHNNFSSFVRQLNTYGFRKIVPDRWEFSNDCFRRGKKMLLCDIHRRKISPGPSSIPRNSPGTPTNSGDEQVLSSNSSPSTVPVTASGINNNNSSSNTDLLEENERLRRDNQSLTHELTQMKNLCNSILVLMSNYTSSQQENSGVPAARPLELLQAKRFCDDSSRSAAAAAAAACVNQNRITKVEENSSPRLFGVPIGVMRMRRENEEDNHHKHRHQKNPQKQEEQEHHQNEPEMAKSEPLGSNSEPEESPWLKYNCRSTQLVRN